MKFKKKGRTIYKTKEKNYYGKTPAGKFFSAALTVLLLGGLGFLGYSIADPLLNYSKKQGDSDVSATETEKPSGEGDTFATAETIGVQDNISLEQFSAAALTSDDMGGTASLTAALEAIPKDMGIEYVVIPLKVSGGALNYSSTVTEAQLSGAVSSSLTLGEITSAVRTAGFRPVAEISLLRDNILPQTYPESGYRTTGDGSRWIDDSIENGGKSWVSPFTEKTQVYLRDIADEIAAADFDKAICSDAVFPPFRESDLELLGEEVNSSERYNALVSVVNTMYSRLMSGSTAMMLEVSAVDLLQGNDEVIQPMLLNANTLVLNVDFAEMGDAVTVPGTLYEFAGDHSENASKIIGLVQHKLGDYNITVRFSGAEIGKTEFEKLKEVLAEYGYSSYVIG